MKLLVLVSRFPYPLDKGDKLRAYHQIKELAKKHEIYLICLTDQRVSTENKAAVAPFCKEIHVFDLFKPVIYLNTFFQLFTDKPFQVGYFFQRRIHKRILNLTERIQPNHIYCQLIRTAEYVKNIQHIPKTIDYMDSLGKGMFRRAAISHGLRKYLFQTEGNRLTAYENRIFDYFENHTIISEQDRKQIQHPSNNSITIVENGISSDFLDYQNSIQPDFDLVFVGNLSYAPNVECAVTLAEQIIPALNKANRHYTLLLSGTDPNPRVKQLQNDQVVITGWVDDIRTSYCRARVFVAPLFIGTGLQNKLLEALALGIPCITTSLANNALGATNGESILLADTIDEFVSAIHELIQDPEMAERLGREGKKFVSEKFNWQTSTSKLEALFLSGTQASHTRSSK